MNAFLIGKQTDSNVKKRKTLRLYGNFAVQEHIPLTALFH